MSNLARKTFTFAWSKIPWKK